MNNEDRVTLNSLGYTEEQIKALKNYKPNQNLITCGFYSTLKKEDLHQVINNLAKNPDKVFEKYKNNHSK